MTALVLPLGVVVLAAYIAAGLWPVVVDVVDDLRAALSPDGRASP